MALNLELHSNQLLIHPILQNIEEGLLITDTSFNIIFFNSKAEQAFGVKAENILGSHVDNLKPPLNLTSMIESNIKYSKDKAYINGTEYVLHKRLLEVSPDIYTCYVLIKQIDSFKNNQLETLLESPYEGIAIFNNKNELIYANQVCYGFFKSKTKNDLINELLPLIPKTSLNKCISKGKPIAGEIIEIGGRSIELIFLPILKNDAVMGVIVKSSLLAREERTWGEVVEKYNQGTARYYMENIVGTGNLIIEQKQLATKASRTISTVLITGESGTGKEIFAHAIHNMSPRRKGPFIKVNCAAVPENLLESELFGYAEGAFTGARKDGKPGKFELANHGTIFLDEIGDMSLSMQAKLLRVLQEKEVERIGDLSTTKVDVRVIAATNQNLEKLVIEGKFREDLYYRLNVIILNLPPLRLRRDDIPIISTALLERINKSLGTNISRISDEVIKLFINYNWPGNIRELANTLERAINFSDKIITIDQIPEHIKNYTETNTTYINTNKSLDKQLEQHEKQVIMNTLVQCNGNKSQTAKLLNIHRSVLYRKMHKYDIKF